MISWNVYNVFLAGESYPNEFATEIEKEEEEKIKIGLNKNISNMKKSKKGQIN